MDFQPTAQPLVAGVGAGWSRRARWGYGGWPVGWAAQGTLQVRPCKLVGAIHGACAPAQPPRPTPDTFRRFRPPRKEKRRSKAKSKKQKQKRKRKRKQSFNSSLPRALTDLIHAWRGSTRRSRTVVPPPDVIQPSPGNFRRRGGVGWQDRWRHGPEACLGRFGQDAQPRSCRVRRTAHTSKAPSSPQGWVYGVSCQPTPPRPTQRNPEPLWLWPWLWPLRVQGAGCNPAAPPPLRSPGMARR